MKETFTSLFNFNLPYLTKDDQRKMFGWDNGLGRGLTMQQRRWRRRNRRKKARVRINKS